MEAVTHFDLRTTNDFHTCEHVRNGTEEPAGAGRSKNGSVEMAERVAILHRELEQPVVPGELEFAADVGAMRFHGARTDEKLRRDFLRGLSLRNGFEHAAFGEREVLKAGTLVREEFGPAAAAQQEIRQRRAHVRL